MLYIHPNNFIVKNLYQNKWQIHRQNSNINSLKKQNFNWKNRQYKNSKKNTIKCGVIVFNETLDEIVLIQNNYSLMKGEDKWGLPKGHRELGETYATCARRELLEETGIDEYIRDDMFKIRINNSYYFPIILNKNKVKLDPIDKNEIAQAMWIKVEKLEKMNVNRETKIFIKRKLKVIQKSFKKELL